MSAAISKPAEIDTARAVDLIREPRSMAGERVSAAISQPAEIDTARAIDLIRGPRSMAGDSVSAAIVTDHAGEARHV